MKIMKDDVVSNTPLYTGRPSTRTDDVNEEKYINKSDLSCVALCNPSLQMPLLFSNHLQLK
jgi:hypothetical protein